jgi:adenosylmethionine---8-amino-7-oxononanoate aminotransferase
MASPLAAHARVRGLRQCGMIIAFDVDSAGAGFATRFAREALRREVVLRPIGSTVYFMPPYTLSDDEFALLVERTLEVIDAS